MQTVKYFLAILILVFGSLPAFAQSPALTPSDDKNRIAAAEPAELIEIVKRHVWPDTDIVTRMAAQRRIKTLGRKAPETVVPLLIHELKTLKRHDKSTVQQRIAMIETLRDIGPAAEAASTVLIEILQDADEPNEWVGMAAQMALSWIGSANAEKALSEDSKSRASAFASKASQEEIHRSAEHTSFSIRQELRSPRPHEGVLTSGLDNLEAFGPRAANALPTLLRAYLDPRLSAGAKSRLADVIAALGMSKAQLTAEAAKPPVDFDPFEDLMADVANQDDFISSLAMSDLGKLGPSERAIDALIAALDQGRSPGSAANALGKFGTAAGRAVPHLKPYLANRKIGANAIQAVGKIAVTDAGVINELRRIARSNDAVHRGMAASTLSELGVLDALPDIQTVLTDKRKYTRILAAKAIARFEQKAAPAAGDLGKLLEDADHDVRRAAVDALGTIGPAARPQATAIARQLESDNDRLRRSAEKAIEKIGGPVAQETKALRVEAQRTRDLITAKNLIAGSKFEGLGRLLNRLPGARKLTLAQSLADHKNLQVAYTANATRVLYDGDDAAVRRVIEIVLQHEKGPKLLQGLVWSMMHGAGEVSVEEVMAKLTSELQVQLQSAPPDVQERFNQLMAPAGGNNK